MDELTYKKLLASGRASEINKINEASASISESKKKTLTTSKPSKASKKKH